MKVTIAIPRAVDYDKRENRRTACEEARRRHMDILILNGSPRSRGNTAAMVAAFREGAQGKGHKVTVINVCKKQIAGCLGCEYCHTKGNGVCKQKDDMQEVYTALETAEMLVLASPIYFFGMTGQLDCAIHRTYAIGRPKRLQKNHAAVKFRRQRRVRCRHLRIPHVLYGVSSYSGRGHHHGRTATKTSPRPCWPG